MRDVGDLDAKLRALGHDVVSVRLKDGVYSVEVTGSQQAADVDLAALLAAGPDQDERIRSACRRVGVTPRLAAMAASLVALVDGVSPPAWALAILRRLDADMSAELS